MNWLETIVVAFLITFFIWVIFAKRKDKQDMEAAQKKCSDPAYWKALAAENLVKDPYVKPSWATHQIELTEDYWFYHMLASVVDKGTVCDARMNPDGTWLAHVNDGLTKGNFDFDDSIVKVLKHY